MPSEVPLAASAGSQSPVTNGTAAPNVSTKEPKKSGDKQPNAPAADGAATEKLSNAEIKKRQKAEKIARRAREKEQKGLPPQSQPADAGGAGGGAGTSKQQQNAGTAAASSAKGQTPQKRRPSTSKSLPHRPLRDTTEKPSVRTPKPSANKQVALFAHLYGQPRRTTIEGASKDVHPAVLALGLKMSSYTICGSTARCVAMLVAFKKVIESYTTPPGNSLTRHLTSHLSPQIEYLVSCRPLSTSMGNAIRWLKLEISDVDPDTDEERAKTELCEAIDIFIRDRVTVAGQVIAEAAQDKIQDGDVILTFAKSNVVQQAFVQAFKKGRRFKVIVVDSRPLHEGRNLAQSLADVGIDVTYSTIHSISHLVESATKVFLGAHSVLGNGRLYSRAGSAMVAMCATDAKIPVIVCCESVKFTDRVALDSIVMNEVAPAEELIPQSHQQPSALSTWKEAPNLQLLNLMYDVTPAEYISTIVTEYGSLPPTSVPVVHRLSTNT